MAKVKKVSRKERKALLKIIHEENKIPPMLIVAELFLIVMCASYTFKINGILMDIALGPEYPTMQSILILEMDMIFLVTTVFAALSISSHRAESWRKVVRSCFTFTFATVLSTSLLTSSSYSHAFDFNPYATGVILMALVAVMLFSKKIKEFYTPPMTEVPKLIDWIIFIVYGKLFDTTYHIAFGTESKNNGHIGPDFEMPDDLTYIVNSVYDGPHQ